MNRLGLKLLVPVLVLTFLLCALPGCGKVLVAVVVGLSLYAVMLFSGELSGILGLSPDTIEALAMVAYILFTTAVVEGLEWLAGGVGLAGRAAFSAWFIVLGASFASVAMGEEEGWGFFLLSVISLLYVSVAFLVMYLSGWNPLAVALSVLGSLLLSWAVLKKG